MAALNLLLGVALALYPLLFMLGGNAGDERWMVFGFGGLLILRLLVGRLLPWRWLLVLVPLAVGYCALNLLDPELRPLKLYPALISLGACVYLLQSLRQPVSAIEQLVRRLGMTPSALQSGYLRGVTLLWAGFFVVNLLLTVVVALVGTTAQWAFYSGFLGYLIMALLFASEYLYRLYFRRRYESGVQPEARG